MEVRRWLYNAAVMWICGHSQHTKQLAHYLQSVVTHNSASLAMEVRIYNAAVMWIYMAIHNTNNSPIQAGCLTATT
jgi:hypothetical protein